MPVKPGSKIPIFLKTSPVPKINVLETEDIVLEKFKDIQGLHSKCPQYHDMVRDIFIGVSHLFPILTGLFKKKYTKQYSYELILGPVQNGKTRPIHLIIWHEKFINRRTIIFITANRSSARHGYIDDTDKFNQYIDTILTKYLDENWNQWWIEQFDNKKITRASVHMALLNHFSLKGQNFRNYEYGNYINGKFPVFLQEKTNIKAIFRLYKKTIRSDNGLAIVIDEVHKMYTDSWENRQIDGLTNKAMNNNNLMRFFKNRAIDNKLTLYGMTATPCRVFNDPHIAITHKFMMKCDGYKGCFYHGLPFF